MIFKRIILEKYTFFYNRLRNSFREKNSEEYRFKKIKKNEKVKLKHNVRKLNSYPR